MQEKSSTALGGQPSLRALLETAIGFERQHKFQEAERLYLRVLAYQPNQSDALHRIGVIRSREGKLEDAADLIRKALSGNSKSAYAHNDLGNVLLALRRPRAAIEHYESAIAEIPQFADVHSNFAAALTEVGDLEKALSHYEIALHINPIHADAHNNLGALLQRLDRRAEGISHFEAALAVRPEFPDALNNLGTAYLALNGLEKTIEYCRRALILKPEFPEAYNSIGNALIKLDRPQEAIPQFEAAISLRPRFAEAYNNLGTAFDAIGNIEQAMAGLQKAIAIDPAYADPHANMGAILTRFGKLDEARQRYESAIKISPDNARFLLALAELKKFKKGDPDLVEMERHLASPQTLIAEQRTGLHFALAKAYGDIGEHVLASQHMLNGNSIHRRQIQYDESEALQELRRTEELFTQQLIQQMSGFGDQSNAPIFIVGMPRSGTTLIEQVLASHPAVFGAGELRHFSTGVDHLPAVMGCTQGYPEFAMQMTGEWLCRLGEEYVGTVRSEAPDALHITDKMPHNFRFVGLIHLALPNARIIHARRNPVDTCLSCYSIKFSEGQGFSYDLAELGRFYCAYDNLMNHWRHVLPAGAMIEVDYETLVDDFEQEAKRIIAYCGLDWHPACMDFYKTQRPVRTASATQVRQPLYNSSVGRWRPYAKMLRPLLNELGFQDP